MSLQSLKEIVSKFRTELSTQRNTLVYKRISDHVILIGVPVFYSERHEILCINAKSFKIILTFATNGRVTNNLFCTWGTMRIKHINYFGDLCFCNLCINQRVIINLICNKDYVNKIQFLQKLGICIDHDLLEADFTKISINCFKKYRKCYTWPFRVFQTLYDRYSGNVEEICQIPYNSTYVILINYLYLSLPEFKKVLFTLSQCNLFYHDYLRMRRLLLNSGYNIKCPLVPVNKSVKYWHDYILSIYTRHAEKIQLDQLQLLQQQYEDKYYSKAKFFEYENDEYIIKACKKLSELQTEGQYLNHCVGSYTKSVANGYEYILFLRKQISSDTPYFTLDLTPEKVLRQAHGKSNCNVPTDLMPFIQEWANKFSINIDQISSIQCPL